MTDNNWLRQKISQVGETLDTLRIQQAHDVPLARAIVQTLTWDPENTAEDKSNRLHIVATRGTVFLYRPKTSVWNKMSHAQIKATVQQLDGVRTGNGEPLRLSNQRTQAIYKSILTYHEILDEGFFDHSTPGIPFRNGFVKIGKDGTKLLSHSPNHRVLSSVADLNFDAAVDQTEWKNFLAHLFRGDKDAEDKIAVLQEFVGASLCGMGARFERCLLLLGAGANGKSSFLDAIKTIFPNEAITSMLPQDWISEYYRAELNGKLINIVNELPKKRSFASDRFKAIVTGDSQTARVAYGDVFRFEPTCGHIFATNMLPKSDDHSEGLWRRFTVIPFNHDFQTDDARVDRGELHTRLGGQRQAIAAWAIEGAVNIMRRGQYKLPSSHHMIMGQWRAAVQTGTTYPDLKKLYKNANAKTTLQDVYYHYQAVCHAYSVAPPSKKMFSGMLKDESFTCRRNAKGLIFNLQILE